MCNTIPVIKTSFLTVSFEAIVLGSPEEIWGFELPVKYS